MSRAWRQCVSLVRHSGVLTERLDYQVEFDGRDICISEFDCRHPPDGRPRNAGCTVFETGTVTSTIDGRTTGRPYVLAVDANGALRETAAASTMRRPDDAPVVFGPSAVLTLAEEWLAAGGTADGSPLQIGESLVSPYPPHAVPGAADAEVPLGTLDDSARLEALLMQPAAWSRPLAALDADRFASLRVSCRASARMPATALLVDSIVPLTANPAAMEWQATLSVTAGGRVRALAPPVRIVSAVEALVGTIVAAAGPKTAGVVRDPVAGDHYGRAAPLLTSLLGRDLAERT